jgi:hypothetical protein
MLQVDDLRSGLTQFNGTETYHRFSILYANVVCTDGAIWLAEKAECYWLMELIASYQKKCLKDESLSHIQFWTLKVNPDKSATIICERDTDDVFLTQEIPYTDFPISEQKLYVGREGSLSVILLPSEY